VVNGPTPEESTVGVEIRGVSYGTTEIEVDPGTTVRWTNQDPLAHTVTAEDGSLNSGDIDPGASWSYTFIRPGRYPIYCMPHPFMKAVIVVREVP
jgi:plastocyanin